MIKIIGITPAYKEATLYEGTDIFSAITLLRAARADAVKDRFKRIELSIDEQVVISLTEYGIGITHDMMHTFLALLLEPPSADAFLVEQQSIVIVSEIIAAQMEAFVRIKNDGRHNEYQAGDLTLHTFVVDSSKPE